VETNPLVQENKISGFNQGICVDGGARGQIKKNEIFHNAKTGLTLMKGADPFVSENDVHHGNEAGKITLKSTALAAVLHICHLQLT
jgi:hypothetical protein